jgi:hypothetical protein
MSVYRIVKSLEETPGMNDKLEILRDNYENEELKTFFKLALDPMIIFGIKKIPKYDHLHELCDLIHGMNLLVDTLSTRKATGNAGIEVLRALLACSTPEDAILIERIIKKDPNCKVAGKLINKIWPGHVTITPYMRCQAPNEKNFKRIHFPAIVQKKANGLFANIIVENREVKYISRNGKEMKFFGKPDEAILSTTDEDNFVIIGEGLVLEKLGESAILDRSTGNGILNKAIKQTISESEAERVIFEVWDVVPLEDWKKGICEQEYIDRWEKIVEMAEQSELLLIDTKIVNTFEGAEDFYKEMIALGEEGAVLKNKDGKWKDHTSPDMVKMKIKDPADLLCTGVYPHKKKADWIGGLVLESADGKIVVKSGSGLDEKDRVRDPDYFLNKIIELEYNEITTDKKRDTMSLFLPIYIGVRYDKDTADTYEDILEKQEINKKK